MENNMENELKWKLSPKPCEASAWKSVLLMSKIFGVNLCKAPEQVRT